MAKITIEDVKAFAPLLADLSQTGYTWARENVVLREYPLSEETGLPTLPEGYFFRVTEEFGFTPRIELRFRSITERPSAFAWLGVKKPVVTEKVRKLDDWLVTRHGSAQNSIREAAIDLLKFLPKKLRDVADPADFKPFLGDYPPKSIL